MHEKSGWIVWNFEYKPPHFENKDLALSVKFPQFANVYHVTSTKKGNQNLLKCDCLLYERCGIPCSHALKITDQVAATMKKTLEGVSCAFWLRRVKNKCSTHARYFYSADR